MPRPLAEIVIEEGLASAAQVSQAAEWCDREAVPLVVGLVREVGVDEHKLVTAIRRHVRVGLGDPATVNPELDALRQLPREAARRIRAVPLGLAAFGAGRRILDVAVADPTDTVSLAELEHLTGCAVEPRLMPLSAVEELVESSYRHLVTEVMKRTERPRRRAGPGAGRQKLAPDRPAAGEITAGPRPTAVLSQETPAAAGPGPSVDRDLALRHQALLNLLVEHELVSLDEYEAEVRRLTEGRGREG